jgi:biotin transport system ATP-binding protein
VTIHVENLWYGYGDEDARRSADGDGHSGTDDDGDAPGTRDADASEAATGGDAFPSRVGDAAAPGEVSAVLCGLDLHVDDGEWVVIAGANGSGKTTLVRHLPGLLTPDAGTVRVDGVDVAENPVAARTAVGTVFQHPRDQLVAATVGADVAFGPENLGLPRETIDRRVETALSAVGMDGRERARVDELSGGERARVAIAGALAMGPDHLVLDEPLAGLDWPARRSVLAHLRALNADGTAVVVVTHDLRDVLAPADRLVVLADGRVVLAGAPDDDAVRDRLAAFGVRPPGTDATIADDALGGDGDRDGADAGPGGR